MKNIITSAALLGAIIAAPCLPAIADTTAADPTVPTSITRLANANTIQVTELCSTHAHSTSLVPSTKVQITFAKPGKFRISAVDETPGSDKKPNLLVSDGTTVSEYLAHNDEYLTRTVSTSPQFQLSQVLELGYKARYSYIGDAFASSFKSDNAGTTYTSTDTTLDNTLATEIVGLVPPAKDPRETRLSSRIWVNKATGLPIRYEWFSVKDGADDIYERIDYTNWQIDKPVDASTFTWTAPKTATKYPEGMLLAVGTPAPDFTAVNADGKTVHLSDYKGKTVILDFWATWCVPCQHSMPHLESVYNAVKDQNVEVLALCVWDEKPKYQQWVKDKKSMYTFPTAFDPSGMAPYNIANSKYAVMGIPSQYVIDKTGTITYANMGGYEKGDHGMEDALAKVGVTVPVTTASADAPDDGGDGH